VVFNCPLYSPYGSTEAGAYAVLRVIESNLPKGHIGRILPGITISIEDDNGNPVAPGEQGQVKVLAPLACRVIDSALGGEVFDSQGRFVTGDLGYYTPEKELVLTGRLNDVINSAGTKLAPEVCEAVVLKFVAATQIAAFGIPNAAGSEDIGIALVTDTPVNEADLILKLQNAFGVQLPFRIFKVDALPTNARGKVNRNELRKTLVG
jgi:acyl-coenzyme A synthetase/AMP-(fatty) acid ligase